MADVIDMAQPLQAEHADRVFAAACIPQPGWKTRGDEATKFDAEVAA